MNFDISENAQRWLANGERGISSEAIFSHLTGLEISRQGWRGFGDTPSDPDDLRRCRLLLEQVPEFQPEFVRMAMRSDMWLVLVREWDKLCGIMDAEAPRWRERRAWSCPKTYKAMERLARKQNAA